MKTKTSITIPILLAVILAAVSGCVSQKKYDSAVAESNQLKAENKKLSGQINNMQSENASLRQQYEVTKSQYQDLQASVAEEERQMDALQKKLEAGLTDFMNRGVDVEYKNGLLYVSMEENLMYKTNSAEVGAEGKKALSQLATVLNDYPKLQVLVVGHTDTISIKGKADNWSLSTERANGVVRILRDDNVDPKRLVAAGRGKFEPVAENSTAEGRAKNRRTEIILRPDMERLWKESVAASKTK